MSIRELPDANVVIRLRNLGVARDLCDEVERRLQDRSCAKALLENRDQWIAWLEAQLPADVVKPPMPYRGNYPKYTGD